MADKKISQLTTIAPTTDDILAVVDGADLTVTKKATIGSLPVSTATQTALDDKEDKANKGVANGYAPLDATGKVPIANLPSAGSGDMLASTYDPENGARQVAFKDSVQTALNAKQDTLGFTPENVANKDTDTTLSANSDTKYPSQKATKTYVDTGLSTKQDTLVSGTNIKTINGNSVLGGGDLEITATGGGSGVQSNVYLTNLTSTIVPAYKQTSYSADATETLVSATVNNNTVLMQSYIFDLPLEVTSIPAGTWSFNVSAYVSSATGVTAIRVDTYKRTAGGVETLLFSATTPEINNTTKQTLPPITSTQPAFATDPTDYIVTKIYATTTSNTNITVTYAVGDGSATYFNTPLPLRAPQVRFNPTTDITSTNVQTAIEEVYSESVHLTGDQTIAGAKTFSTFPVTPSSAPTADYQTANKKYVDDGLATKVPTSRTITINGTTYDLTADRSFSVGTVTSSSTDTLTNKRITKRVSSETSNATPAINCDSYDEHKITALATAPTFGAPTGTPTDGQIIVYKILDNGTARALAWNAIYVAGSTVALPTTTTAGKWLYVGFEYSSSASKWHLLGVSNGF